MRFQGLSPGNALPLEIALRDCPVKCKTFPGLKSRKSFGFLGAKQSQGLGPGNPLDSSGQEQSQGLSPGNPKDFTGHFSGQNAKLQSKI